MDGAELPLSAPVPDTIELRLCDEPVDGIGEEGNCKDKEELEHISLEMIGESECETELARVDSSEGFGGLEGETVSADRREKDWGRAWAWARDWATCCWGVCMRLLRLSIGPGCWMGKEAGKDRRNCKWQIALWKNNAPRVPL